MNKTVFDEGIEKGRRVELLELVCGMLEDQFGPVSAALRAHVERLPLDELRRLARRIGTAKSPADLGLPAPGS